MLPGLRCAAGQALGGGVFEPVTGVSIHVSDTAIQSGDDTPPPPCDAAVTLQPGAPYVSKACAGARGRFLLIRRAGGNATLALCRADVSGPAAIDERTCAYSTSRPPPGNWQTSCMNATVDSTACKLAASCHMYSYQNMQWSELDLRTCGVRASVENVNGNLTCAGE